MSEQFELGLALPVKLQLTLECSQESKDKGRLHCEEDVLLVHDVALLSVLDDARLLDALQRVGAIRDALDLDQLDETKSAGAQCFDDIQIRELGVFDAIVDDASRPLVDLNSNFSSN